MLFEHYAYFLEWVMRNNVHVVLARSGQAAAIHGTEVQQVTPTVRATAVLIEDGCILLVEQQATPTRDWSLPGGKPEWSETLEECVVRETREETGLDVDVDRLLYVCDRIQDGHHRIHITFTVKRRGGDLRPEPVAGPTRRVRMVPLAILDQYGFSKRFRELAATGFLNSGTYQGPVANIGL